MIDKETKEAILEARVKAALGGHELGPFERLHEPIGGYEAECRLCGYTIWVAAGKIHYDGLDDVCPGEHPRLVFKMRQLADPEEWEWLCQWVKEIHERAGTHLYQMMGFDEIDDGEK